ncbi:DUF397 domain-containing protein [Streptomyces sp. A 4/2]|nr:DUF397 domain-containing protein [Streptomyces sp. NBC_01500]WSC20253.1 DUF397 domain-containing protein [Streptomyces sp. NBC_01766]
MTWWKSSRSEAGSQCVECGIVDGREQVIARPSRPVICS